MNFLVNLFKMWLVYCPGTGLILRSDGSRQRALLSIFVPFGDDLLRYSDFQDISSHPPPPLDETIQILTHQNLPNANGSPCPESHQFSRTPASPAFMLFTVAAHSKDVKCWLITTDILTKSGLKGLDEK